MQRAFERIGTVGSPVSIPMTVTSKQPYKQLTFKTAEMLHQLIAFVLATSLFGSFSMATSTQPVTIEGIVLSAETGKPLSDAHVFIVKGEEEAVTNASGAFRIVSWQHFPLLLTIKHPASEEKQVKLTAPPKRLQIVVKSK